MTRISGKVVRRRFEWGYLYLPAAALVPVGDRLVPPIIEVDIPGVDGAPSLRMAIEVIDGVPRCTELTFSRSEGGREVRVRDLRAIPLEDWIENFVALCAGEPVPSAPGLTVASFNTGPDAVLAGIKTIRDVRKGSRRPLTRDRKLRVAEVYNAQETGGIEAVERAFGVSRSTAIRYIRAAREAGLIAERG